MKYGDAEWLEKVAENYKFPLVLALYLPNNKTALQSLEVKTTAERIGNIKFDLISPDFIMEDGSTLALLDVKRVYSAQDYYEWTMEHKKVWGIE